jgi:hypothetical protein
MHTVQAHLRVASRRRGLPTCWLAESFGMATIIWKGARDHVATRYVMFLDDEALRKYTMKGCIHLHKITVSMYCA